MKIKPIIEQEQSVVTMEGASGAKMRMLIGPDEDARNFYMRHFEVEPGGFTPHHQHDYEHEVIILKGSGMLKSEQGDRPFKAGDAVWIPPNEMHQFQNTGDEPIEFICLIPSTGPCS